jgi:hypothetical protein
MPTPILGLRGTGEFNQDFRPTNYRELFTLLEPNGTAPLNALLAMATNEATDDPKFNNFRDELPDRTLTVDNETGYNATTTTLQMDAGSEVGYVLAGSIVVNSRTGEVMHATADGNTVAKTITVTRNIGGTSHTINDGDQLFVAGFAAKEGSSAPNAISFDAVVDYNYTQIFKTPFKVSGTLDNTRLRTGNKYDEAMTKALKLHMSDIERAFFWSIRNEVNGSTSEPLRFTGGLMNLLQNQTIDVSTFDTPNDMTEDQFDRLLIDTIFAYGSAEKLAFVGATVAGHLQKFGKNRWQPTQVQGTYGVNVTRYQTFAGDLMVHLHPQFRQVPGMDSAMVILDLPHVKYRYLQNRDTHLQENIQANDEDAKKSQYLTECGLELTQSKVHAVIKNWKTVS